MALLRLSLQTNIRMPQIASALPLVCLCNKERHHTSISQQSAFFQHWRYVQQNKKRDFARHSPSTIRGQYQRNLFYGHYITEKRSCQCSQHKHPSRKRLFSVLCLYTVCAKYPQQKKGRSALDHPFNLSNFVVYLMSVCCPLVLCIDNGSFL